MGLRSQLKEKVEEYRRDPSSQYYKYLKKVLNLHSSSGVSKKDVLEYVKKWGSEK